MKAYWFLVKVKAEDHDEADDMVLDLATQPTVEVRCLCPEELFPATTPSSLRS